MKIVEPSQAQNGKERKEGTEEGKSCCGEEFPHPWSLMSGTWHVFQGGMKPSSSSSVETLRPSLLLCPGGPKPLPDPGVQPHRWNKQVTQQFQALITCLYIQLSIVHHSNLSKETSSTWRCFISLLYPFQRRGSFEEAGLWFRSLLVQIGLCRSCSPTFVKLVTSHHPHVGWRLGSWLRMPEDCQGAITHVRVSYSMLITVKKPSEFNWVLANIHKLLLCSGRLALLTVIFGSLCVSQSLT